MCHFRIAKQVATSILTLYLHNNIEYVIVQNMHRLIEPLRDYFSKTLKIQLDIHPWTQNDQLPIVLNQFYDFYETRIFKSPCLLMISKENTLTPAIIRKHVEQVQKIWNHPCIYIQEFVTPYNRQRLMEHHIPFVVPGNQMYLPELGIDLREHFRQLRSRSVKSFSPATQAVLLYVLQHKLKPYIPSELAKNLSYTLMTMSRAFDELERANIGQVTKQGKERRWYFTGDKKELWNEAKSYMRNPVKFRTWIPDKKSGILAGLSALAEFSQLNPPELPVVALSFDQWKILKKSGIEELPSPEAAAIEVEVWNYDPDLFAKKNFVDQFSLYFSLNDNQDERVQTALEEMMETIKW